MPYWDRYPYKTETHNGLPQEILSKLLSAIVVNSRLSAGEDPIDLSIEKWENLLNLHVAISENDWPYIYYSEIQPFAGYETCALCLDSIARYSEEHGSIKYKADKCSVCSLAKIDRCIDQGSVYSEVDSILNNQHSFTVSAKEHALYMEEYDSLKVLFKKMVELLKELK